jgi:hypothetical protein
MLRGSARDRSEVEGDPLGTGQMLRGSVRDPPGTGFRQETGQILPSIEEIRLGNRPGVAPSIVLVLVPVLGS